MTSPSHHRPHAGGAGPLRSALASSTLVAAAVCCLATAGSAHERKFTQSRDWFLPYQGESEFEFRNFLDTRRGRYVGQLEYEYGLTRHVAIEPGIEVAQNEDGDYEVEAAGVEVRLNAGTYAPDKWLPGLNFEYEHPFEDDEPDFLEAKAILARYGSNGQDLVVNANVGQELESGGKTESEVTAGWLTAFDPDAGDRTVYGTFRGGVEAVYAVDESQLRAGPLLVYHASKHFNLLGSYLFAVNDRNGDNPGLLSLIVEFEL